MIIYCIIWTQPEKSPPNDGAGPCKRELHRGRADKRWVNTSGEHACTCLEHCPTSNRVGWLASSSSSSGKPRYDQNAGWWGARSCYRV